MNIFEHAARIKLRFDSVVGQLTTENLFDLPLVAKGDRPNLDTLARAVYTELKSIEEGSFVELKPDPRKAGLELRLEILKHVIAVKLEAKAASEKAAADAERKRKLLNALSRKEEGELEGMTKEQIEAEIAKLGS